MPRTKLICVECKKEIPASETKQGEAVILSINSVNGHVTLRFCKRCGKEHKLGQYREIRAEESFL